VLTPYREELKWEIGEEKDVYQYTMYTINLGWIVVSRNLYTM